MEPTYWNRAAGRVESERVAGGSLLRFLYSSAAGLWLSDTVLSGHWLSRLAGAYQSLPLSRYAVPGFIRAHAVPMDEFEAGPFRTFNAFFIRRFRPGARRFCTQATRLPAFVEGRYLAYAASEPAQPLPVKGHERPPADLLGSTSRAARFAGGPVLVARLCPADYHRFHYPDDGSTLETRRIGGRLHSVSPIALRARPAVLATNERVVSILRTAHFGRLAYVEVGALCVGRIVQTHPTDKPFRRGDEKGYFLFGASTVIVFGEAGCWTPDEDLLKQTARGLETLVRLGEPVARVDARGSGPAKE